MQIVKAPVREKIKQWLKKFYLDGAAIELARASRLILNRSPRWLGRVDHRIIKKYFSTHDIRKLHIGCGGHILDGWLNTDIYPKTSQVFHLDATLRFPFGDGKFDYIFSEHMIEHIPYLRGVEMLRECCRVLKKEGKIRISTPDLAYLISLCKEEKSDKQMEYVKWQADVFAKPAPCSDKVFVINNFMREWGHQFIYDEETLSAVLKEAGFKNVTRRELNQSESDALRFLENEKREPEGFLMMESLILEGTK
ncbi:MAG TPA: methyltransferase domain-containing protein [Smithella sp.]|nr:methyltransferase domain-containing protein [Smithella sp.]